MDNDEAGILNTSKIAEKLGLRRTYIVKHSIAKMKDANDFLMHSPGMIKDLINKARTIPDSNIISFSKLRETIKSKLLNEELEQGMKISWLPFFNQKVKGVRLGELTVVSGPTGSGKTTFLSQLFLDLCQRDIGVLWGSFEIRN
jgi:twinkle protein